MCRVQVLQSTALAVRGPSESHPVFTVSLDGVAIDHENAKGAIGCLEDFVRHPLFTQRTFSPETGIGTLNNAVAAADAVRHSSKFDPWRTISVEAGPVIGDPESRWEKILLRRKTAEVGLVRTLASSAVDEGPPPHDCP